jgi:hypothetical protein
MPMSAAAVAKVGSTVLPYDRTSAVVVRLAVGVVEGVGDREGVGVCVSNRYLPVAACVAAAGSIDAP